MAKENSTYFSPMCFFCGKNNKRRHSRVARSWTCSHCKELNPGPAMLKAMARKFANGHAESREPVAPRTEIAPLAKVAASRIKGISDAAPVAAKPKPATKPVAARAPAAVQPVPTAAPAPPPAPKRGLFDRLAYG